MLLSTATSTIARTATCGRGVAVSASQHAVRSSVFTSAQIMGEQGKDRGFEAKRQDTGVGLSEVVKTDG